MSSARLRMQADCLNDHGRSKEILAQPRRFLKAYASCLQSQLLILRPFGLATHVGRGRWSSQRRGGQRGEASGRALGEGVKAERGSERIKGLRRTIRYHEHPLAYLASFSATPFS